MWDEMWVCSLSPERLFFRTITYKAHGGFVEAVKDREALHRLGAPRALVRLVEEVLALARERRPTTASTTSRAASNDSDSRSPPPPKSSSTTRAMSASSGAACPSAIRSTRSSRPSPRLHAANVPTGAGTSSYRPFSRAARTRAQPAGAGSIPGSSPRSKPSSSRSWVIHQRMNTTWVATYAKASSSSSRASHRRASCRRVQSPSASLATAIASKSERRRGTEQGQPAIARSRASTTAPAVSGSSPMRRAAREAHT